LILSLMKINPTIPELFNFSIMKTRIRWVCIFFMLFSLIGMSFHHTRNKEPNEPWNSSQLLAPSDLAKLLRGPKENQPIILSVGPGAVIKNSMDIGPTRDSINLIKFKEQVSLLSKDARIVIYCGCCPFEHCPNIRPAFTLLNKMGFINQKLLNLEHNIKIDWIKKGYPVKQ
jgi:thiosulfate/3-mercaptopyruvate sulfurtransferase